MAETQPARQRQLPINAGDDVLVAAAKKRLLEIDSEIAVWAKQQKSGLDVDYYNRKKSKKFEKEAKEIYDIELFLALKDPGFIENHISVT
jgi:hypothetical protein